jgi:hypothetical protein
MPSFVTPPGVVKEAFLYRPLILPRVQPIWCVWLTLDDFPWPSNVNGQPSLYKFVSVTAPAIYDVSDQVQNLHSEIAVNSKIRIAGTANREHGRTVLEMIEIQIVKMVARRSRFALETL